MDGGNGDYYLQYGLKCSGFDLLGFWGILLSGVQCTITFCVNFVPNQFKLNHLPICFIHIEILQWKLHARP